MASRAIKKEELLDMLERYNIGRKPLARLLGWGETTILLYAEADDMPDNELTHRLYALSCDPVGYARLLCINRDRITDVAYRKSLAAVCRLFPMTKLLRCADFIVNETAITDRAEMSLMRVETILFWGQVLSLCFDGVPLFDDIYRPDDDSIPYAALTERLKLTGSLSLSLPEECMRVIGGSDADDDDDDSIRLNFDEKQTLYYVTSIFSWYGHNALTKLMEAEQYRLCGPVGARRRKSVSADMLRRCYSDVFQQNKVTRIKDVESYMARRMNFIRKQKPDDREF